MELLGAFYRKKLRRKQKMTLGRSDGALCKTPSETSVNGLATGLISKVLRLTVRRSEPGSRPHSWHSTKLGEGPQDSDSMMQVTQGVVGAPWHQSYHSSVSTTDLSGFESGFLRKSPDQYSSRGSMESLEHSHPAYSSCYPLSSSKSSTSIDHLHNKRDSAYSSFSTSSSIPEYLTAAQSFNKERSYSMDNVLQRDGMQQADIRYIRTVYDPKQGVSEEHEITSAALLRTNDSREQSKSGVVCHRGSSSSGSSGSSGSSTSSQRHSIGPVWDPAHSRHSLENLKGAPAPPLRSDSYAAFRNHDRPNSWSSLEHSRSQRTLHKGSWHNSIGSVATGKSSFGAEGQLHTVIEKSPESSPTTKPKQSFAQTTHSGQLLLQTSIYPVPTPEPHFAHMPTSNPNSSSVYPALTKESKHNHHCDRLVKEERVMVENGYQSNGPIPHSIETQEPKLPDRIREDTSVKTSVYRPHFQTQVQKSQVSYVQERRDPYTPVHPRGEKPRLSSDVYDNYRPFRDEEQNKYKEQTVPHNTGKSAQRQSAQTYRGNLVQTQVNDNTVKPSRHYSDSGAFPQREQDLENPLTKLENALAEVQRCISPESTTSQYSVQSERSMSVLEKVSHFERQQVKPRSHSSLSHHGSTSHPNIPPRPSSAKSSFTSLENMRTALERSNSSVPHRRNQSTSSMASYDSRVDTQKDFQTRRGSSDHVQLRQQPDPTVQNKTCLQRSKSTFQLGEESSKDFHEKGDLHDILGTIQDSYFNRAYRDSIKDAQSKVLRSTSFRRRDLNPPPVPAKHMPIERKVPSTSPKPTTSPHTPKERHVVPVDIPNRTSPPELPSVPAVGPPVIRICGRKRFTMEQKKRSYSEPENMHEVGVTQDINQAERKVPQPFLASETSVADRRRMFEQAANRNADPRFLSSRPVLKQMQQDALVEYMERKTGKRVDGRPNRPHSAYLQSASSSSADSRSLTSTPSLCSLQDPGYDGLPGGLRKASTLPAGMQSSFNQFKGAQNHVRPVVFVNQSQGTNLESQKQSQAKSRQHFGAVFERASSARSSGRSASAEDLLDRSEERPIPQHFRSKSSPVENVCQDFLARDMDLFRVSSKDFSENRLLANTGPKQPSSPLRAERSYQLNQGPVQQYPPVLRRERQRYSERPRAQSASGLAASVGLPCPLTSPATTSNLDWQNGDRLCHPNLDSIAFPETGAQRQKSPSGEINRQNSSDTSTSEDTLKDFSCPVAPPSPQSSTNSKSSESPTKPNLSLRISETHLKDVQSIAVSQGDDEVFLAPPSPSPPPPPLPFREIEVIEDFPPPPPPLTPPLDEDAGLMEQPKNPLKFISDTQSIENINKRVSIDLQSPLETKLAVKQDSFEILGVDGHLLSRRERTHPELLVESLARELVKHDRSLTSLLDAWAGKNTLDLMEDTFPSHQTSSEDMTPEKSDSPSLMLPRKMETNLDDEDCYLNQKKVELLSALRQSLLALRGERDALVEEQKRFTTLAGDTEALVQQRCKPNEREKYRVFVGDQEKIVNLLLSLSARRARVENSLSAAEEQRSPEEQESLQLKRKQLCSQQEDARELKENLDRREQVLLQILSGYLSDPQLRDYQRWVRVKPALLIQQRHLDDLIREGAEHLHRLEEILPLQLHPKNSDSAHTTRPTTVTSL
ncbi:hypothetical protein DNTS_004655 [Danionella cerebrum]|uniref:ASD2 domain-containing protein n=1 Tax=Danionella cerebrum TaxID=2873325 RepID=A0A553QYE4_9TELE|nr:hypothetical protein DNTS_004655 [Danionella translucida]